METVFLLNFAVENVSIFLKIIKSNKKYPFNKSVKIQFVETIVINWSSIVTFTDSLLLDYSPAELGNPPSFCIIFVE